MAARVFWIAGPWPGRLGIVPRPRGREWLDGSRTLRPGAPVTERGAPDAEVDMKGPKTMTPVTVVA